MAEVLPINFPIPSESAIASYDWTDLVSGLGYETFYLTLADGVSYNLTTQNIESKASAYNVIIDSGETDAKIVSSIFNQARIVKGNAYAYFTISRSGNSTGNITVNITVQKYDGSSYTNISSADNMAGSIATGYQKTYGCLVLPCTETVIKKGEQLVLNITTTANSSTVMSNSSTYLSAIDIPFKIAL